MDSKDLDNLYPSFALTSLLFLDEIEKDKILNKILIDNGGS
jgi:hypothetical protein